VGEGLLPRLGPACQRLKLGRRGAIITDSHVAPLYASTVEQSLTAAGFDCVRITVPAGEAAKSLKTFQMCCDQLAAHRLERTSFIVALGGGVVGDLAGFVAASYLRGIPFVQVPTTLLAQVDSSVGGKVAVNLKAGKNLVGAFYQPRLVLCDLGTLRTLPQREFCAGLAEVIKYGVIYDAALFERLERLLPRLRQPGQPPLPMRRGDPAGDTSENSPSPIGWERAGVRVHREGRGEGADRSRSSTREISSGGILSPSQAEWSSLLEAVVARCCQIKAEVVGQDETETGLRAILNFGHTIGHAIENSAGYGKYLHGEAIAMGQAAAAWLSQVTLGLPESEASRLCHLLTRAGLPTGIRLTSPQKARLLAAMKLDKKVSDGEVKFVLVERIGQARWGQKVPQRLIEQALDRLSQPPSHPR